MLQDAIKNGLSTYDAGTVELDWYTAEGEEPTIRVKWYEPICSAENGSWSIFEKQQLFPFTTEGSDQASSFAYSL